MGLQDEEAKLKQRYYNAVDKWERLEAELEAYNAEHPDPSDEEDEGLDEED